MEKEKIYNLMNEYIDGQCTLENEKIMFSELAQNDNYRMYFRNLRNLKKISNLTDEKYPIHLDKIVLKSIKGNFSSPEKTNYKGWVIGLSFAFSIIILFSFILIKENNQFKYEISQAINKVNEQDKKIELLINSYSGIEVNTSFDKEILIKSN
mgnify:CR=1 FL=1